MEKKYDLKLIGPRFQYKVYLRLGQYFTSAYYVLTFYVTGILHRRNIYFAIFQHLFFIFEAFSLQIWVVLLVMMYVYLYIIYGLKF